MLLAQHNSFVMIINHALGGESKTSSGPPRAGQDGVKDLGAGHANVDDAVAAIMRAMTF